MKYKLNLLIQLLIGAHRNNTTRVINEMKEYIVDRRRGVLAQIKLIIRKCNLNESNDGFFQQPMERLS